MGVELERTERSSDHRSESMMDIDLDNPLVLRVALERHVIELPAEIKGALTIKGFLKDGDWGLTPTTEAITQAEVHPALLKEFAHDSIAPGIWYAMLAMGTSDDRTPPTRKPSTWLDDGSQVIPLGHDGWILHVAGCGLANGIPTPRDEKWSAHFHDTFGSSVDERNQMIGLVTCNCGAVINQRITVDITHDLVAFMTASCDLTGPVLFHAKEENAGRVPPREDDVAIGEADALHWHWRDSL